MKHGLFLLLCLALSGWAHAAKISFEKASQAKFAHPHDLTLGPDGRLYVADLGNNVIKVLQADSLNLLFEFGATELLAPHDVSFDERGMLHVADTGHSRIVVYVVLSDHVELLTALTQYVRGPEGVDASQKGQIFISNTATHNVAMFQSGAFQTVRGHSGTEEDAFLSPHDIEVAADGFVFVADPGNNRIKRLNPQLQVKDILGGDAYAFSQPKYLALDKDMWLYVADQDNNQIRIFDTQRRQVAVVDEADGRPLNGPEGVEVVGESVWISDTYNNRVLRYHLTKAP